MRTKTKNTNEDGIHCTVRACSHAYTCRARARMPLSCLNSHPVMLSTSAAKRGSLRAKAHCSSLVSPILAASATEVTLEIREEHQLANPWEGFCFVVLIFEIGSHHVFQAGFDLMVLLPQPPKCLANRLAPACPNGLGLLIILSTWAALLAVWLWRA